MASGIFIILDDIAMLMDDIAVATKVSINKTVPILADDLAVNAQKASGFSENEELDVLWQITKGSLKNKLIILPFAFLLNFIAPWLIAPILVLGGCYLAYEGAEQIYHFFLRLLKKETHTKKKAMSKEEKIKSAIFTDFILSIEIIILALSTVMDKTIIIQIGAVSIVSLIATVGVYGLVALLVRMDDVGVYFIQNSPDSGFKNRFGQLLILALPRVIKVLTVIGTVAMLLVAGGIFTHNISFVHHMYTNNFIFLYLFVFDMILAFIVGFIIFSLEHEVLKRIKKH